MILAGALHTSSKSGRTANEIAMNHRTSVRYYRPVTGVLLAVAVLQRACSPRLQRERRVPINTAFQEAHAERPRHLDRRARVQRHNCSDRAWTARRADPAGGQQLLHPPARTRGDADQSVALPVRKTLGFSDRGFSDRRDLQIVFVLLDRRGLQSSRRLHVVHSSNRFLCIMISETTRTLCIAATGDMFLVVTSLEKLNGGRRSRSRVGGTIGHLRL